MSVAILSPMRLARMSAQIARQKVEIEQLRTALQPFAKMYARPGSDLDRKIADARRALEGKE